MIRSIVRISDSSGLSAEKSAWWREKWIVIPLFLIAACQVGVKDSQLLDSPVATFYGWAVEDPIRIEALNQQTQNWEQIGMGTIPEQIAPQILPGGFGTNLYEWWGTVDFDLLVNRNCYFGAPGSCDISRQTGEATAQIRFIDDVEEYPLANLNDQEEVCAVLHGIQHSEWINAGIQCRGPNWKQIKIRVDSNQFTGCLSDADCDDQKLCNGVETCGPDSQCLPGNTDLVMTFDGISQSDQLYLYTENGIVANSRYEELLEGIIRAFSKRRGSSSRPRWNWSAGNLIR